MRSDVDRGLWLSTLGMGEVRMHGGEQADKIGNAVLCRAVGGSRHLRLGSIPEKEVPDRGISSCDDVRLCFFVR